jgi:Fe-S cluster assembly iron-binding protein IscA
MPNINFSAPVIRLGTTAPKASTPLSAGGRRDGTDPGSAGGSRLGLGAERGVDAQRQAMRDNMLSLVPPTKDEIVRTVFVGGITEGCGGNDGIERLLSTAGRLRRWDRAVDAAGKQCSFGFAQFDDAESLLTAVEVLKDIEIPVKRQPPSNGVKKESSEDEEEIEKSKLLVFVDDNSLNYLENYQANRGDDSSGEQTRLDAARAGLKAAIYELFYPPMFVQLEDGHEDTAMHDAENGDNVEVVNIPIPADDELADIPAEIRETVLQEIAAFRDRSTRRDIERLKREEEMEAAERQRAGGARVSRLASPGPQAPSGPAGGTNNIPLGPRGVPNAPSGPKGQGSQMPRDYQQNVKFVNGSGTNGTAGDNVWISREDEEDSASDSELERRRQKKKEDEQNKQFLDQERRWINREKSRTMALQREKEREDEDAANASSEQEKMAQRFKDWDDELESTRKTEEYYRDRSIWNRNRATFRNREAAADDRDREAEKKEQQRDQADKEQAGALAESFLDRQAEELGSRPLQMPTAQQPFKLSLGAAAQRSKKEAPARRTVAEVEGLLEDEEDVSKTSKRTLIPIKYDPSTSSAALTDDERDQAIRQLAADIPTDKEGLWDWKIKWDFVDEAVIVEKLRPFVEKKIMEYLGVQEQLLVEVVENHVRERGSPSDLVMQLEGVS